MSAPIAVTAGEPAGIGPDLLLMLAREAAPMRWLAIADAELLRGRAQLLGLAVIVVVLASPAESRGSGGGRLEVLDIPMPAACVPGQLDVRNVSYVLATLERACAGCLAGEFAAMVTGPVQKSVIADAGIPFSGHTEWLQARTGVEKVVMLLVAGGLRVALATTHLPLRAVSDAITPAALDATLAVLLPGLRQYFNLPHPRLLVAGLNPHAGESGHLGHEEQQVIAPTIARWCARGWNLRGPLPADTLFTPHMLAGGDAVLAMYHDQGLPVLKHVGFDDAVNVTLGLPIVRTSVDHGTALDLAGTGRASVGSLRAALKLAVAMGVASSSDAALESV